jgi:tetratricopeptide (TPR) repeat protein
VPRSTFSVHSTLTQLSRVATRRPEARSYLESALRGHLKELVPGALAVAVETGGPIGLVLADLIEGEESIELVEYILAQFDKAHYRDSIALRSAALAATQKVLLHRQASPDAPGGERLAEIGRLMNNLSFSLSLIGRHEEALDSSRKAVDAFRQLIAEGAEYRQEMAVILSNLGVAYSRLTRYEAAQQVTEDAVQLSRRLAAERPGEMLPVLAQNLLNLGAVFFSRGQSEDALWSTQEAFLIFRRLAKASPSVFGSELARSLSNLGTILRSLGRFDEAIEVAKKSVELRKDLAADRPDIFDGDLAASLEALAATFLETPGHGEEALPLMEQAVKIRRRIAQEGLEPSTLDLARSLEVLATAYLEVGMQDRALHLIVDSMRALQRAGTQESAGVASSLRALLEKFTSALDEPETVVDPTLRADLLEQIARSVAFFFERQPLIFADPMNGALLTYLAAAFRAGREPNRELLRSIIRCIEREILEGSSGSP